MTPTIHREYCERLEDAGNLAYMHAQDRAYGIPSEDPTSRVERIVSWLFAHNHLRTATLLDILHDRHLARVCRNRGHELVDNGDPESGPDLNCTRCHGYHTH